MAAANAAASRTRPSSEPDLAMKAVMRRSSGPRLLSVHRRRPGSSAPRPSRASGITTPDRPVPRAPAVPQRLGPERVAGASGSIAPVGCAALVPPPEVVSLDNTVLNVALPTLPLAPGRTSALQ